MWLRAWLVLTNSSQSGFGDLRDLLTMISQQSPEASVVSRATMWSLTRAAMQVLPMLE